MKDKWIDIPNFEGLYMINNLGSIKSINYKNTGKEKDIKRDCFKQWIFTGIFKEELKKL